MPDIADLTVCHQEFPVRWVEQLHFFTPACYQQPSGLKLYCLFGQFEPLIIQRGVRDKPPGSRIIDLSAVQVPAPVAFVGAASNQDSAVGEQSRRVLIARSM